MDEIIRCLFAAHIPCLKILIIKGALGLNYQVAKPDNAGMMVKNQFKRR